MATCMCVMVDYYTKWAEVYTIPNKSAEVVSQCIINLFTGLVHRNVSSQIIIPSTDKWSSGKLGWMEQFRCEAVIKK